MSRSKRNWDLLVGTSGLYKPLNGIKGEKGEAGQKGLDGVFPEPPDTELLYGRYLLKGETKGEWSPAVRRAGDEMTGALSSPSLTTGPDDDDKAILKMDDGQDAYNGGPHELEARSGQATDWDAWIAHKAAEDNPWQSVTFGNGKFVAVAFFGSNRVMASADGEAWEAYAAAEANDWYSVTYGNGKFVAVANSGTNRVMTSVDGEIWVAHAAAEDNSWWSVTYAQDSNNPALVNGKFVAVAYNGTNRVMTSVDGEIWVAHAAAENNSWYSVTYGNGKFVAVAGDGTNRVMTSVDGEVWVAHALADVQQWSAVTYGNGKFVAVAQTGFKQVMTSVDGEVWESHFSAEDNRWKSVTYGNGKFVAVSANGTNRVMTSVDGKVWEAHAAGNKSWYSVTYGNGKFVGLVSGGTMTLDAIDTAGGLYFDNELLYTSVTVEPIREKVNVLANAVINNAESIEIMAPSVFKGTWDATAGANPGTGDYSVDPETGLFADVTSVLLDPIDGQGVDFSSEMALVTTGDRFTILNVADPYGLSGTVVSAAFDSNGNFKVELTGVRSVDDPNGGTSVDGAAVIKVQKSPTVQGGPTVVWSGSSLPTTQPDGSSLLDGTLFFHNSLLNLYIYAGSTWLQLN